DAGGLEAVRQIRLPVLIAALLGGGVVARLLQAFGLVTLPPLAGIAAWAVPLLAVVELRRVLRSILVHVRRRQIRTAFRFPCSSPATVAVVDGGGAATLAGTVTDINESGA